MKYSLKQIRVIIVLMSINAFALFVNYIGLKVSLHSEGSDKRSYLFTTSNGQIAFGDGAYGISYTDPFFVNDRYFYPFVSFYDRNHMDGSVYRGLFPYYDFTEFFVYTVLIFGVPFIYNYIKKREFEELKDKTEN